MHMLKWDRGNELGEGKRSYAASPLASCFSKNSRPASEPEWGWRILVHKWPGHAWLLVVLREQASPSSQNKVKPEQMACYAMMIRGPWLTLSTSCAPFSLIPQLPHSRRRKVVLVPAGVRSRACDLSEEGMSCTTKLR